MTERFTRTHFGHMSIEVTIDDPGAYIEPWSATQVVHVRPGWEPLEFICAENNRDVENPPGGAEVLTNVDAARQRGYVQFCCGAQPERPIALRIRHARGEKNMTSAWCSSRKFSALAAFIAVVS